MSPASNRTRPEGRERLPRLRISRSGQPPQLVQPAAASLVVGSSSDADLVLPADGVQSRHALLRLQTDTADVMSLSNSARLTVNGEPASRARVKAGDSVGIGPFTLSLEAGDEPPQSSSPPPTSARPPSASRAIRALNRIAESARRQDPETGVRRVLGDLLDCLLEIFGAERGIVLLPAQGGVEPQPVCWRPDSGTSTAPNFSRTATQTVFLKGTPLLLAEVEEDLALREAASIRHDRIRSVICAPLASRGGATEGVVYLDSRAPVRTFSEEDLDILAAFGQFALPAVREARERQQLREDVDRLAALNLEAQLREHDFHNIVHRSPLMQSLLGQLKAAAGRDVTCLLLGESGTGKELLARALHHHSKRSRGPFVAVNCMALAPELVESELFGHEKGAYSGAVGQRVGRFEFASGGTLLLDEVGELPAPVQGKLLRVLQEGELERVGGNRTIRVDVRIVGATHRELRDEVAAGRFREDLYYRLNVLSLRVPPLRERAEDVPALVTHLIGVFNERMGRHIQGIEPDALQMLCSYHWPGNVRELRNLIERAFVLETSDVIGSASLPAELSRTGRPSEELDASAPASAARGASAAEFLEDLPCDFSQAMAELERLLLRRAIRRHGGNVTEAARELGLSRRHLHRRLTALGL